MLSSVRHQAGLPDDVSMPGLDQFASLWAPAARPSSATPATRKNSDWLNNVPMVCQSRIRIDTPNTA